MFTYLCSVVKWHVALIERSGRHYTATYTGYLFVNEQHTRSAPSFTSAYMELHHLICQKHALRLLPALVAVISVHHHMAISWCLERERERMNHAVLQSLESGMTCHWPRVHHPAQSDMSTLRQYCFVQPTGHDLALSWLLRPLEQRDIKLPTYLINLYVVLLRGEVLNEWTSLLTLLTSWH